jgi:magnesium transporter
VFRKRHPPPGSRPGTLALPAATAPPRLRVIDYDADRVDDRIVEDVDELVAYARSDSVTWIDIQGLSDERMIRRVGEIFRLHPLALADAVNVPQRPKSEAYDEHHLFITRMGRFDAAARELVTEQVSIFFGPRFVLTLQERAGDVFEPLRQRIHTGLGVMRRSGPD